MMGDINMASTIQVSREMKTLKDGDFLSLDSSPKLLAHRLDLGRRNELRERIDRKIIKSEQSKGNRPS
jgi:hypothetical protein